MAILPTYARVVKHWPGYIDNSECQKGNTECGAKFFEAWNSDGVMYKTEADSDIDQFIYKVNHMWNAAGAGHQTQKLKIKISLNYTGIPSQPFEQNTGITLYDGHDNLTKYRLKGFGYNDAGMGIQIHLCKLSKSTHRCEAPYGTPKTFNFKHKDMLIPRNYIQAFELAKDGNDWIGISWYQIWTSTNAIRLGVDHDGNQMAVRSLKLPGVRLQATLEATPLEGNGYGPHFDNANTVPIGFKVARLNDRKCSLNITGTPVQFSTLDTPLSITTGQTGIVGPVKQTRLQMSCENGVFDDSVLGIDSVDRVTPISGKNALHSITSIRIEEKTPVNINGSQINMTHKSGEEAKNLYVLGSFSDQPTCKVEPLPINTELVDKFKLERFPNSKIPVNGDDSIPQFDIGTIHWRLCKEAGSLKEGKYSGSANIVVEYK